MKIITDMVKKCFFCGHTGILGDKNGLKKSRVDIWGDGKVKVKHGASLSNGLGAVPDL